jgi:hypothetical protein
MTPPEAKRGVGQHLDGTALPRFFATKATAIQTAQHDHKDPETRS